MDHDSLPSGQRARSLALRFGATVESHRRTRCTLIFTLETWDSVRDECVTIRRALRGQDVLDIIPRNACQGEPLVVAVTIRF